MTTLDQQPQNGSVPLPLHKEDPYELVGMVIPGDEGQTELMAQALIEEYILLGWSKKKLMNLFANPFYLMTHRVYKEKGEAYVQALIDEIYTQWHIEG